MSIVKSAFDFHFKIELQHQKLLDARSSYFREILDVVVNWKKDSPKTVSFALSFASKLDTTSRQRQRSSDFEQMGFETFILETSSVSQLITHNNPRGPFLYSLRFFSLLMCHK